MGEYAVNPYEELAAKLEVVEKKIDYVVRLLKQNGFKDYERDAAYVANLAMAKEINANWAKEVIAEWKKEQSKIQGDSKSE